MGARRKSTTGHALLVGEVRRQLGKGRLVTVQGAVDQLHDRVAEAVTGHLAGQLARVDRRHERDQVAGGPRLGVPDRQHGKAMAQPAHGLAEEVSQVRRALGREGRAGPLQPGPVLRQQVVLQAVDGGEAEQEVVDRAGVELDAVVRAAAAHEGARAGDAGWFGLSGRARHVRQ